MKKSNKYESAKIMGDYVRLPKDNYVRDNHLCLDFEKHETPTIRNGKECIIDSVNTIKVKKIITHCIKH